MNNSSPVGQTFAPEKIVQVYYEFAQDTLNKSCLSNQLISEQFYLDRDFAGASREKVEAAQRNLENAREQFNLKYPGELLHQLANKVNTLKLMQHCCGGQDKYDRIPVLDITAVWVRDGEFLDFITPKMMTAPVMRGEDRLGRAFIAIRIHCSDIGQNPFVQTQVFFQRYVDQGLWSYGNHHAYFFWGAKDYIDEKGVVDLHQFDRLTLLYQLILNRRVHEIGFGARIVATYKLV